MGYVNCNIPTGSPDDVRVSTSSPTLSTPYGPTSPGFHSSSSVEPSWRCIVVFSLSLSLLYHAGFTAYPPTRMSTIPNPQNARNKDIAVGPVKLEKAQHELGVMVPHMRPPCGDGRKGETTG